MKQFKEWLSDYLRYFLLLLAAVLAFFLILAGVRIYQNSKKPDAANAIQILTETEMETAARQQTETVTASETTSETESESETEQKTEAATGTAVTKAETAVQAQTSAQMDAAARSETAAAATEKPVETQPPTEKATETQPVTETEYTPVYMTLKGSCYIRSGPSMDAEIIGEYMYGTTVEFLEDVGGWYKVQIDGMVGYMGARFF